MRDTGSGKIESIIDHPSVRSIMDGSTGSSARLSFVYGGHTSTIVPLSSGSIRYQAGLQIRTADPCNLIYAMWRWTDTDPALAAVVVQTKINPGHCSSSQCGTNGYQAVSATGGASGLVPVPVLGVRYSIGAEIVGSTLTVTIGDVAVWVGELSAEALSLSGPAGLRSDNVVLLDVHFEAAARGL